MRGLWLLSLVGLLCGPRGAEAAVTDTAGNGFAIQQTVPIAATPLQVYAALTRPDTWWSSDHTFSGDAANMTMDARPGGCWCEKMGENGGVQHMTVTFAAPGAVLILRGALGPFYDAPVDGVLKWNLKKTPEGTELGVSFRAAGYSKDGFEKISTAVDHVLAEQAGNLKKLLEKNKPSP